MSAAFERPRSNPPARVELVDFGDFCRARLLAEYDAERDTIGINAQAVERVRSIAGVAEAMAFVTCAIVHERFHRENPQANESSVHEHVRRATGYEPRRFEAMLGGAPTVPS